MEPILEPNSNVIVNYLPTSVSEDEFRAIFAPYGTIHSCKLVKDKATNGSAGYGFVQYLAADSAIKAISNLNGSPHGGKRLKVTIARPHENDDSNTNIYISSMPLHWTEQDLSNLCSPFGNVLDAKVLTDLSTKQSRGVGFVRMENRQACVKIIQAISGNVPPGATNKLVLKFAETAKESKQRKLLGHLPGGQDALHLMAASMQGGGAAGLAGLRVPIMSSPMAAQMLALQQQQLLQQQLLQQQQQLQHMHHPQQSPQGMFLQQPQVQMGIGGIGGYSGGFFSQGHAAAAAQADKTAGYCLFVYHLVPEATENMLVQLFSTCGKVLSAKIMRNLSTGMSKGFGFVNMASQEQAEVAIRTLSGYQLGAKTLKVDFKR